MCPAEGGDRAAESASADSRSRANSVQDEATRIVTRNSVTSLFSTTTLSSETHAPLIPWIVSDALAIPAFTASAKLVGDDA